jgi:effector-binding domain-containing protein
VQLHRVRANPVAVIRRLAKPAELSQVVPECCGIVWNVLRAQQVRGGRHVAIYLGEDRVEVGAELLGSFTERGEVVRSATPSGMVASLTHLGPYGTLGVAHNAIREWARHNNRSLVGPSWEIYGHWQEAWNNAPSQIRTDVFYLLG